MQNISIENEGHKWEKILEKAISSVEYSLVLKELDKIDLKSLPEKEKNIIKDSIKILEEVYYHNVAHKAFEWNESNIHSPMVSYSLFMFVREFYPDSIILDQLLRSNYLSKSNAYGKEFLFIFDIAIIPAHGQ